MKIKDHPVPVAGLLDGDTIGLATYSDLKQSMLEAVYAPTQAFPILADILLGLEMGNGSLIVNVLESFPFGSGCGYVDKVYWLVTISTLLELVRDQESLLELFEAFYNDIVPIYQKRAFFTAEGGHTGYASNQVLVGDKVCVFYDGSSI